jgi:hypothetical protein
MQKAVQDTAGRLLTISGPSPSGSTPVPEGFSCIQIIHHELGHCVCGSPHVAIVSPLNFRMLTTDVSTIRLGHAAANAGLANGPNAKPTKMCRLCKSMQKAVQDTACRLLTIGTSGPLPSSSTPVPEGFSCIQIIHHELGHHVHGSPHVAIVSPLNFRMSTTDVSTICLGHAAANVGLADRSKRQAHQDVSPLQEHAEGSSGYCLLPPHHHQHQWAFAIQFYSRLWKVYELEFNVMVDFP